MIPRKISRKKIVEDDREKESAVLERLLKNSKEKDLLGLEFHNDTYWVRLPKKQSKNIYDYSLKTDESISENLMKIHTEMIERDKNLKVQSKVAMPELFSNKRIRK